MKRVTLENIRKDFHSLRRGRVAALDNISLEIEPGAFFVLLGPSGCGKSTLLNIIAGIEKPTDGTIRIGDQVAVSVTERAFLSPRERDIAMVFQSYALYPHMTVRENIAFPLKIAKLDKTEIRSRVDEAAATLQITSLLDARPAELSGGQRQRVALGRAIVRRPNLLLLDEPLSNLDALLRISMRAELKQIQRRLNVTTLYVTHDQTEAMSLGDRIAVLRGGKVLQVGTPDEIYNDPSDEFVGRFIGSPPMNLLPGELFADAPPEIREIFPEAPDRLTVGLRPEQIRLCPPENGVLRGRVTLVGSLGGEKIVYLHIAGHEVLVRVSPESAVTEGADAGATIDRSQMYFFNRTSGARVKAR